MATRAQLLRHSLALMIAAVLFGSAGCGNNFQGNSGAAGHGGRGGAAGGTGGGGAGMAGAGVDGGGAGVAGSAAATGGVMGTGGMLSPQQIHDALLNAPTNGGIEVQRTAPAVNYPACR